MTAESQNSKRIARNTLLLYLRMFLTMAVSFYTSRMVLQALGVTDYGVYNVVGGVTAMFGFINGSLGGASSRFITFALGKGDEYQLRRTFNCVVTIHYLIAIAVIILAETVGLWFVMSKLVIPVEREWAAFWTYQSTVAIAFVMLVSTPFNALIIAHERMGAFAYITIFEATAKLAIVAVLFISPYDRLIVYSMLIVVVQVAVRCIYTLYCRRHFAESRYHLCWDKAESKRIFAYAGWTVNGNLAVVGYTQGLNILLNLFFGPVVNAARGIAVQVQGVLTQFFYNFQMAVNPQIVKSYANGDLHYMHKLVLSSSRLSFYLMLLVSLPVLFQTEHVLHLWLGQVPDHTVSFVRVMIVVGMNYTLSNPTIMAIHATGNIRRFQIVEGTMLLSVVPVAYVLLKWANLSPEGVFLTYFLIEVLTQLARVWIVFPRIGLPIVRYFSNVLWPIARVLGFVWVLPLAIRHLFDFGNSFVEFLAVSVSAVLSSTVCIYVLGLLNSERAMVMGKIRSFIRRKKVDP